MGLSILLCGLVAERLSRRKETQDIEFDIIDDDDHQRAHVVVPLDQRPSIELAFEPKTGHNRRFSQPDIEV